MASTTVDFPAPLAPMSAFTPCRSSMRCSCSKDLTFSRRTSVISMECVSQRPPLVQDQAAHGLRGLVGGTGHGVAGEAGNALGLVLVARVGAADLRQDAQ